MSIIVPIPGSPAEVTHVLQHAADVLRRGGLVAFPTETVYGLGAVAIDEKAVQRIFEAKGRPSHNPLIVHVADSADVLRVAAHWPPEGEQLARHFWPGPLTLVLPKRPDLPDIVTAGGPTVAVRVPAHPIALQLIQLTGAPLAAPSANRSGELSPTTADHVARSLGSRVDLILDAGPTNVGLESTVVNLSVSPPQLLRPGQITPAQIEEVIGPIRRQPHAISGEALPSPGMLSRHYAPRTPTEVIEGSGEARVRELAAAGMRVGWLTRHLALIDNSPIVVQQMPTEPDTYAARLYATLHQLDEAGLDRIVIDMPPDSEAWLAVRDRLRRAAVQD